MKQILSQLMTIVIIIITIFICSAQSCVQTIHYAAANGCVEMLTSFIDHSGVDPQQKEAEVGVPVYMCLIGLI